jgi:hypothetical protein
VNSITREVTNKTTSSCQGVFKIPRTKVLGI